MKVLGVCARIADGRVQCWGANAASEIGLGITEPNGHPDATFVPGITNAIGVGVGDGTACARLRDGTASCWGTGTGQFGDTAAPLAGMSGIAQLAVGRSHVCGLLYDGTVTCSGSNNSGQRPPCPGSRTSSRSRSATRAMRAHALKTAR